MATLDETDDMLRKAELLAAQMKDLTAENFNIDAYDESSSTPSSKNNKSDDNDVDNVLLETERLIAQMGGGSVSDTNIAGVGTSTPIPQYQEENSATPQSPNSDNNTTESIDAMLKRAELLANQMQSSTTAFPDSSEVDPDTPSLLRDVDAALRSNGIPPTTTGKTPGKKKLDTPGLINQANMLLDQKYVSSTVKPTTNKGNNLSSDMFMEAETTSDDIACPQQSSKSEESVEDMLKQAELLANQMQSATKPLSSNTSEIPPLVDEVDPRHMNTQSSGSEAPIDDMLKRAELLAHQMQSATKLDVSEDPPDTPSLLREADTVLRSNANQNPTGDAPEKNQMATYQFNNQTNPTVGQEEPSKSATTNDGFDNVMRQTELLLGKIQNPMSCDTADQTSTTAGMSTSLDKSTVLQSPLVTSLSSNDQEAKLSAQVEQLEHTEEMVRIMAQTLASLQQPDDPADVNKTLQDSAAIMQQAMTSFKDQYSAPATPTPPRSISMARSPSFEEEVSSVGSGSARSVGYQGFDSPGSGFNKTPTATNHRTIAPMPPMHSRGDRPPLPRPPLSTAESAEESARQMTKTAPQEFSKKQTGVPSRPPPPPPSIPKMAPTAAEEKLYDSLVKKMENQRPKKWEKVKAVAKTDEDYVPIKDYSKFGADRKKSEYGDEYVPMADYSRRRTLKGTNSKTTTTPAAVKLKPLQRYQRKRARRRKMVKIALAGLGTIVLIYLLLSRYTPEGSCTGGESIDTDLHKESLQDRAAVIEEVERIAVLPVGDTWTAEDSFTEDLTDSDEEPVTQMNDGDSDEMPGYVVDEMANVEEEEKEDHSDANEASDTSTDEISTPEEAEEELEHTLEDNHSSESGEDEAGMETEDTSRDKPANAEGMNEPKLVPPEKVMHEPVDDIATDPGQNIGDSASALVTQRIGGVENTKKKRRIWQPLRVLGLGRASSPTEKNQTRRKGLLKKSLRKLLRLFTAPMRLLLGILGA